MKERYEVLGIIPTNGQEFLLARFKGEESYYEDVLLRVFSSDGWIEWILLGLTTDNPCHECNKSYKIYMQGNGTEEDLRDDIFFLKIMTASFARKNAKKSAFCLEKLEKYL